MMILDVFFMSTILDNKWAYSSGIAGHHKALISKWRQKNASNGQQDAH